MLFNMMHGVGLEVVGIVGAQIISADASVRVYLDSQKNSPAPDIAQFIITSVNSISRVKFFMSDNLRVSE